MPTSFSMPSQTINTGAMEFVGEVVSSSVSSEMTIENLSLNTDESYYIELSLINNTSSTSLIYMYYSGDTTDSNYHRQTITRTDTTAGGARANDGVIGQFVANSYMTVTGWIRKSVDGKATSYCDGMDGAGSSLVARSFAHQWNSTADVTSITIKSQVASALAVGCKIRVYRIKSTTTPLQRTEGTIFPASPSTGQRFYRTDLNMECYWDGSQWLSVQEYALNGLQSTLTSGTSAAVLEFYALPAGDVTYLTRWIAMAGVFGGNDGANYYTISLEERPGTTTISSFNTSGDVDSAYTNHDQTINAPPTAGTVTIFVRITKVGAPSALFTSGTLYYRLIVT